MGLGEKERERARGGMGRTEDEGCEDEGEAAADQGGMYGLAFCKTRVRSQRPDRGGGRRT